MEQWYFETVIYALMTSQLDYSNALHYGVSPSSLACLLFVRNAAAHLLTGMRKREHITPTLASLRCIFEFIFKILLFLNP